MLKSIYEKFPPISIRITLPTLLAVLIILTVILIGGLAFNSGEKAVSSLADQLTQEISIRIMDHIRTFLDTPHIIHQFNAISIESEQIDLQNQIDLIRLFSAQVELSNSAPFIYYGNENGEFLGIQKDSNDQKILWKLDETTKPILEIERINEHFDPIEKLDQVEFDPRGRPWYTTAVDQGSPTWSPIFADISRPVLIITAVNPVYQPQTGIFQGVMGIELSLEQLSKFLQNLQTSTHGQAFIMERDGSIVASSYPEAPYLSGDDEPIRLKAAYSQDVVTRSSAEALSNIYGDYENIQNEQDFNFSVKGNRWLANIAPFSDNRGIDWLIVVLIPETDIMGPIYRNVRYTAMFGLIVLLLAVVSGLIISRWIVTPIISITDTAADIESGVYEIARLDQTSKRKDELGILSLVFQRMALKIYVREQHLKEQVQLLKIQIDENKRKDQVQEITDTDFFRELREKARNMKDKRKK